MKYFKNSLFTVALLICSSGIIAQQQEKKKSTTVQFSNGNLYGKLSNMSWMKLNDGGLEAGKTKPQLVLNEVEVKAKLPNNKSGNDGKWVVSDYNVNYDFYAKGIPKKMDNYKDSSIIVTGHLGDPSGASNGTLFVNRSIDRGESWHRIYKKEVDFLNLTGFYKVQHPSPAHIIAIAEKFVKDSAGNFEKTYFLMSSSDTAKSWSVNDTILKKGDFVNSFDFNGKYGMIRLESSGNNSLLYSDDYGNSWQSYPLPSDLLNSYGYVLRGNSILLASYSSNKVGYTSNLSSGIWQYENLPDTFSVLSMDARNKDTIWSAVPISSGIGNLQLSFITGTTDGGKNWNTSLNVLEDSAIQARGLNLIDFATKNRGVAVGADISYFTEDGGKSWENRGFYDKTVLFGPQVMFYYYNPDTEKSLLMSLLKYEYIMKYEFEQPTGLTERENIESQLKLYPNPAKNSLFLQLPKDLAIKNGIINILTIQGKEVGSFSLNNSNNGRREISISNLPQGVFILQLRSNNYVGSKLFVKQ